MRAALLAVLVAAAVAGLAAGFVYSGAYDVAADEPHWPLTERLLETVRARSIDARAAQLAVPDDLADPKRVLIGAGQYAEMCEGCHLAPGVDDTPLRQGLYPRPPALADHRMDPRTTFWVVKHGIKTTGMPAWGASHGDDVLWSIVAFVQKLPQLDAVGYRQLVNQAPADEEMRTGGHRHQNPQRPAPDSHGAHHD